MQQQRLPFVDRPLRIAFTGASGTGKTTLAQWIASKLNLPMCPVGSRSVAQDMGFRCPYDVDRFERREEFQWEVLNRKSCWESQHESFVTDRSALDHYAYTALHAPRLSRSDSFRAGLKQMQARYTHLIFAPIANFQNLDSDPARRDDANYHSEFEYMLMEACDTFLSRAFEIPHLVLGPPEGRKIQIYDLLHAEELHATSF